MMSMRRALILAGLFSCSVASLVCPVPARAVELSTSGLLVEEVLSQSKDPHFFDWRDIPLQIEVGYATVDEANSFEAVSYSVGVARSFGRGWLGRAAVRRVETKSTSSSDLIALTPFSQAAQRSRYEFLFGAGYTLLEGRSATPLSPRLTDLGHALYALGGLQYSLYDGPRLPAMRSVESTLAAELGFRFQIFLPHSLGVSLEWTSTIPLTGRDPDLSSWQRFGGNLSWSFGS